MLGGDPPYRPWSGEPPRSADGSLLPFLLQIQFSEAPALPDFPSRGLLQLYLDGAQAVARYLPDPEESLDRETIGQLLQSERHYRRVSQIQAPGRLAFEPHFEPRSTLGGAARFPQHDDPRPTGGDWMVLVKLMEEPAFAMRWGDCQELHIFIRRSALRALDFSNLWTRLAS